MPSEMASGSWGKGLSEGQRSLGEGTCSGLRIKLSDSTNRSTVVVAL